MLDDRYYTPSEVAQLVGVDTKTLRRWHDDRIARASHRTSGRHRRYAMRDVRRVAVVAALRASKRVAYRDLGAVADRVEGSLPAE